MTAWEPQFWNCPDGARLSYRVMPSPPSPPSESPPLPPSLPSPPSPPSSPSGSIILLHGWGDHAGRFEEAARRLSETGLTVYALDQRGHGQSPGPRGHVDRFAQYLSDIAALRKMVSNKAPGPQFLLGHSFGAFVLLRYLETMPAGVAGAIAVTPFVDFAQAPPRWKVVMARLIVDLLPRVRLSTGLDYDHLAHDREQVEAFRADPLAHQRMTPRAYVETMGALAALREEKDRIAVPLLVLLAGDDRLVSTRAAREFANALRGDVTVREYAGMYHNVFYEPERNHVYADIAEWVARRIGRRET